MNSKEVHAKIVDFLTKNGPSLPVHIARNGGMDMLFTGAFLSELYNDKTVKMSAMKIGNSSLYFLPGQEEMLEKFISYLPSKEKEACLLLKKEGFLEDAAQHPAIRVALRGIRDFAFPLKTEKGLFWRYLTFQEIAQEKIEKVQQKQIQQQQEPVVVVEQTVLLKPEIPTVEQQTKEEKEELKRIKKQETEQKFLGEVKEFLKRKEILLVSIEEFTKKEVVAKIKVKGDLCVLIAIDKKRPSEEDIVKAYKRALKIDLPFHLLAKGDLNKKMKEMANAYKKMAGFGKMTEFPDSLEQQSF